MPDLGDRFPRWAAVSGERSHRSKRNLPVPLLNSPLRFRERARERGKWAGGLNGYVQTDVPQRGPPTRRAASQRRVDSRRICRRSARLPYRLQGGEAWTSN
jgi:hypothetical protein